MPIGAIDAISAGSTAVQGVRPTGYIEGPAGGQSFSTALTGAVENMQQLQATSETLALRAVSGDLTDIHAATIAATRAQVTVEFVAAIRNKGVDAFNEIMRMQA